MRGTNIVMRKRLTWVFFLAVMAFLLLTGRLAWIQFVKGEELKNKAAEVRMRDIPVEARRGSIYDRNGNELVTSISVDSVYAIPAQVENPREAAQKLSKILEIDEDKLYRKLTKKTSFEWIKRKVDFELAQQVKELEIKGVRTVEESKRYYLHGTLASHVLGFAGIDNQGLQGLEKSYDRELRGKPGRIVVEHDAMGREIPEAKHDYQEPVPGHNLVLTIDETIQYFVERELERVASTYDPKLAVAIVMDPRTGEVLAMGNRPSFDPNHWSEAPKEVWDRNPAIWYNYEPGSTFKIVTASSALEVGAVQPEDQFFCPGHTKVADRTIRCWKAGGHGSLTFREVVQHSCNPGFIEVGLNLGKERFYKYIKAYGFGVPTGIDLPGEEQGILIPEKQVTNLDIATMAIGQSVAVTPIQLITAVSAVANGGKLMKPYLVKEITDVDGKTVKKFEPRVMRQVISEETSRLMRELLERVVAEGTGKNAFVEGYRVAGKTGTAQVVGKGGYVQGKYVASFAGFAPANDPQVAILVMIAEPKGGLYFGGIVAAPVFQAIARDTLRYLQIPETPGLEKPLQPWETRQQQVDVEVPGVINYPVEEAVKVIKSSGLQVDTTGAGEIVYDQTPKAGAKVKSGTTVVLKLQPAAQEEDGMVTVPDLTGLTMREAASLLEDIGLYLIPRGSGLAAEQSVKLGNKVEKGTRLEVHFRPPDFSSKAESTPDQEEPLENPYDQ